MCTAAKISNTDTVLEIGSGFGSLTELLLRQAKQVIAVELDPVLAVKLVNRFHGQDLKVVPDDVLEYDFSVLQPGYLIVANIPYYLTSNLLRVLSDTTNPPKRAVLLVQREVAERIVSLPGNMSILSITVQYYWEATLGRIVSATLFTPQPKVDSQILILKRREQPLFPDVDNKKYFRIVKAGFSQRRKTLLNSLSGGLKLTRADTEAWLAEANISPARRAQTLTLEDWYTLWKAAQF